VNVCFAGLRCVLCVCMYSRAEGVSCVGALRARVLRACVVCVYRRVEGGCVCVCCLCF